MLLGMHNLAPLAVMRFASPSAAPLSLSLAATAGGEPLTLPRSEGLDLLEWLGLGRPEFGALSGLELAPLCRRRLWPMPRNLDPARGERPRGTLRMRTAQLLALAEQAGTRAVMFG